ncbi:transposable element Tcb2 transposase [Trichonephila clavipes]|nr:transposable element Tcb2 transposase [Trichonephila clavipes]
MEAGWPVRQVTRQLGRSDCVVRRFGDQWIRRMSFTQRPVSGRPRQTSRQDLHIVRNAPEPPTASSAAFHPQVALSQGAPVKVLPVDEFNSHTIL